MNVYKKRLLNVARACREAVGFTMLYYCSGCGTPGCAFGNYCARGDLQDSFGIGTPLSDSTYAWPMNMQGKHAVGIGNYNGEGFLAIREHFGLTATETHELFSASGCDGAGTDNLKAAAYIEAFAARKWPEPKRTDSELVADLMARIGQQTIPDGEITSPEYARA